MSSIRSRRGSASVPSAAGPPGSPTCSPSTPTVGARDQRQEGAAPAPQGGRRRAARRRLPRRCSPPTACGAASGRRSTSGTPPSRRPRPGWSRTRRCWCCCATRSSGSARRCGWRPPGPRPATRRPGPTRCRSPCRPSPASTPTSWTRGPPRWAGSGWSSWSTSRSAATRSPPSTTCGAGSASTRCRWRGVDEASGSSSRADWDWPEGLQESLQVMYRPQLARLESDWGLDVSDWTATSST